MSRFQEDHDEDHDEETMGEMYLVRASDRHIEEISSLPPVAAAVALRDLLGAEGHPDCDCERCTEDRELF